MVNFVRHRTTVATLMLCLGASLSPILHAQVVSTTTTLAVSPVAPTSGQTLTLTATVTPSDATNGEGGVIFDVSNENGEHETAVGLINGVAVLTIPNLQAGTYLIGAGYAGDSYYGPNGPAGFGPSNAPEVNVTVAPGGTGALRGQYAFLFQGITNAAAGSVHDFASAGSFTADGQGNITSGVMDLNTPNGSFAHVPVTGTYVLDTTGRGTLSLMTPQGVQTAEISVPAGEAASTVLTASGTVIGRDLVYGTSKISRQSPGVFSTTRLAGSYALDLRGEGPLQASAGTLFATGQLQLDAAGSASTLLDETVGTNVTVGNLASGNHTAPNNTTGRFLLNTTADSSSGTSHFALYPIDHTHLFVISLDSHTTAALLSGSASQ